MEQIDIMMALSQLQGEIHETAKRKGWWDKPRHTGELIALIHSELSEALEAARHGNPPDDKIPRFSGMEAELADVIIRVLDMAAGLKLDVVAATIAKIEFNNGRPYRHGNKAF